MPFSSRRSVLVFAFAAAAACSSKSSEAPAPTPTGPDSVWYRAEIGRRQGSPVPFFMQVSSTEDVLLVSGPARVHARVTARNPKLQITFDVLHTRIEAALNARNAYDGVWIVRSPTLGNSTLSFQAEPVPAPDPQRRFPSKPGPDATGVWKVDLTKPGDTAKLTIARGTAANEITGTLAMQTGNVVFVSGNQDGNTLRMSSFDGGSPYLLVLTLDDGAKSLTGVFTAGSALDWEEQLRATRTEFTLEKHIKVAGEHPKLEVAALAKPPYIGKPMIVELSGSWCPACGHAPALLRKLRDRYAAQGLQIVTLDYEFTDDHDYNQEAAETFKTKHEVPWEVIPVDGDRLPNVLEGAEAAGFPIAIFVSAKGTVEGLHNGFPSEDWGAAYDKTVAEFDELTARIVSK